MTEITMKKDAFQDYNTKVLLPINQSFTCPICCDCIEANEGILLRNCLCILCKSCFKDSVINTSAVPVRCPVCQERDIQDRESLEILDGDQGLLQVYRNKLFASTSNVIRCFTPDCEYRIYFTGGVKNFKCQKCSRDNCLSCKTSHPPTTLCAKEDEKLQQKIANYELMRCPDCETLIRFTGGCGWIQCSNCGTELCWWRQTYFRGPYGCVCVAGDRCHPNCNQCVPDTIQSTNNSPSNNGMKPKIIPKDAQNAKKRKELQENKRREEELRELERLERERKANESYCILS